jgi:hypothetical protein
MKLADLCGMLQSVGFPSIDARAHPDRDLVLHARTHVEAAVIDDEFLADCIGHELTRIGTNILRQGLIPFFTMPDLGIQFAFGYWAPGGTAGPHHGLDNIGRMPPHGPIDDFLVNELARDAVAFASREIMFAVAELPGDISDEERIAVADALLESGLFTRGDHA